MDMHRHIGALLLLLVLWSCDEGNVILDNPRPVPVKFQFDNGESFELGSHGFEHVQLDPGTHGVSITTKGGEVLADTSFELKEKGIVHSGAGTYLIWRQLYGLQKDRATLLNERWVEFDSTRAFGDFRVFPPEQVFIEGNWDYTLDEDLPDAETMYISTDFEIHTKVFRAKDFVELYKNQGGGK